MSVSVQVFDPAMCCSTGICGPAVEPHLIQFAADLDWLKGNGVRVERFNLAQQPKAFVENPLAKQALESKGEAALPLLVVDGTVRSAGTYPSRQQLAEWAQVPCVDATQPEPKAGNRCCTPKGASGENQPKKCC